MDGKELYSEAYKEALASNHQTTVIWKNYKEDLLRTQSMLKDLPLELTKKVFVPIGKKALMQGYLTHTNEFLVNIGAGYLKKSTASQASEFCSRRIESCDEMLKKLEGELELLRNKMSLPGSEDAFGTEDRPEIVEHVTEEEDRIWKEQHRIREKEYRKQLAQVRANQQQRPIENEEDLWARLDQLELEEELEDELNRLNENDDSSEVEEEEESNASSTSFIEASKRKKSVAFASEEETIRAASPLLLHFKHGRNSKRISYSGSIKTPGDIFPAYLATIRAQSPVSILKVKSNPNASKEQQLFPHDDDDDHQQTIVETGFVIPQVRPVNPDRPVIESSSSRRVSKFKASRMNKR